MHTTPHCADHTTHIKAFIESIWNRAQTNLIDHFLATDYVDHAYQPGDAQGLLAVLQEVHTAFPDVRQEIDALTVQDDMVVCRMNLTGTHLGRFRNAPATGNKVRVGLYRSFRMDNGKIAEHWALLDTAGLLRQIGTAVTPENACQRT